MQNPKKNSFHNQHSTPIPTKTLKMISVGGRVGLDGVETEVAVR